MQVDCGGGRFLVNRYGVAWCEVTAENLLLVTADGRLLEGEPPVMTAAFVIHAAIHTIKGPSGRVVFHTHQTAATAMACTEAPQTLPPNTPAATEFHAQWRCVDDPEYTGIAADYAEGVRIAHAMGEGSLLFMANHGVTLCAPTVAQALNGVVTLESLCEDAIATMSNQPPPAARLDIACSREGLPNGWGGRGPFPRIGDPRADVAVACRALVRTGLVCDSSGARFTLADAGLILSSDMLWSTITARSVLPKSVTEGDGAIRLAARLHDRGAAARAVLIAPTPTWARELVLSGTPLLPISQV